MTGQFGMVRKPALERFLAKVQKTADCWLWVGGLNGVGYGQFYRGKKHRGDTGKTYAHRWSYEHYVGPIPSGLHLDHLCRNTRCVNPDHLEPVTARENLLRGEGPSAIHAAKTHCPAGHPYSEANTYHHPRKNMRSCRACGRARAAAKRAARKATRDGHH